MEGKCKGCGFILGILIIVFAFWYNDVSKWILIAIGIIILLHPIICKRCNPCYEIEKTAPKKKRK